MRMNCIKVVVCMGLLLAAAGGHAQFLDPPPANASAVNGTLDSANATLDSAPDAIAPAPASDEEGGKKRGGGVVDKTVGATKTATKTATGGVTTNCTDDPDRVQIFDGDGNCVESVDKVEGEPSGPNSSFSGLTESIPDGSGCYNMTNIQCDCSSDQTSCEAKGLIWSQDCACTEGGPKSREVYTNFEPTAVPGGIDSQTGEVVSTSYRGRRRRLRL
mmetsp:Transcript_4862/g.14530  ORF Transcript_4862/g.14530 Transcript_4862/m.14530 type:complete len:217 (-) Transcript_4862:344-994(-)